jgi:branched-chain amino acid transport system ATP-binding protein
VAVLEVSDLTVRFGEHLAVSEVSITVDAGEIVGLIGPNGAGKTTTFNAVCGVQACTGHVRLDGVDISRAQPHRRARLGMNRTFQRLEVFGSMSAYNNIRTAAEIAARGRRQSMRGAPAMADAIVEQLGLGAVAHRRADALPTGQARLVELGRVLATEPKVVLLDEPASGLDEVETARLAEVLRSLAARDLGVLLVEHDMDIVMELCARICVLNFGAVIASGTPAEVRASPVVQEAYLGVVA